MSDFLTILQSFFETTLIALVGFVIYAIVSEFTDGRTFKQTANSIEKSVALGVNTIVGLKVLETAIQGANSKQLTLDEVKEILQIVKSS